MEENYLKLASIKFCYRDNQSQAREILYILNSFKENDIAHFNFQSLSNLYDKEVLKCIIELLFDLQSNCINLSMGVYLCSLYDFLDSSTNNLIITKLIEILKNMENGNTTFNFLQIISLTYPLVMKRLIESDLLQSICSIHNKFDVQTYEKIIFLTIQELTEINNNVLTVLKELSCNLDGNDELFLKLISAISITAIISEVVLTSDTLWNIILTNLVSPQSVDRKRAMYWLNRALHTCKTSNIDRLIVQLSQETLLLDLDEEIINNILILIDALEEKQTHVILPVLYKIDNLKSFLVTGRMSVHWLLTVIERASLHESTLILKWALTEFLCLPIHLSESSYYHILSTSFIKTINQSNLYFSPDSISNDSGFFASPHLDTFFFRLFNELSQSENIDKIDNFLDKISQFPWNSHALLFVAESFSKIVVVGLPFSIGILSKIGLLCRYNLVTLNLKYRQCIASFFLIGFFRNHRIVANLITDYISILHHNFSVSETVITDQTLVSLLTFGFGSLSITDSENVFLAIMGVIDKLEINNLNFSSTFNRLSCLSLFISLISQSVDADLLSAFLDTLLSPIRRSYMNPYAIVFDVLKSIISLKELHSVSGRVPTDSFFRSSITDFIESVMTEITKFLSLQIEQSDSKNEIEVNCVSLFKYFVDNFPNKVCDLYFMESSGTCSIKTLVATNLSFSVKSIVGDLDLLSLLNQTAFCSINALYYESLKCLARYLSSYKATFDSSAKIDDLVGYVCDLIDITVPYKGIIALIHLGGSIVAELFKPASAAVILTMVKCLWSSLLEHNSNAQTFWKLYSVFLSKVFNELLIIYRKFPDTDSVRHCLDNIVDTVFKMGENKFGMVHLLGETVHGYFVKSSAEIVEENSDFYIDLIGRLVLFGPCHRRGLRFENRIERYLSLRYGDRWHSHRINKTAESGERVGGLLILCLKTALSLPLKERMIDYLRNKDREIVGSNLKSYKNYANNHIHRTRHRLFSALLLVLHSSVDSLSVTCRDNVEQWMKESIQYESLNSIRHLSEWIYTILCCHDVTRQTQLIAAIKAVSDSKPAHVCSLITVCRHIVVVRTGLVDDLVMSILPLCSAQNYNIRLYAVSFIVVIQQQRLVNSSSQLSAIIDGFVSFLDRSSASKNVTKLLSNFWWTKFDPSADVCLETVFAVLPPLFDLVEEEVIGMDQFLSVSAAESRYYVRFGNCRPEWTDTRDSVWRVKTERWSPDDTENCPTVVGGGGDVQKKVQPWITCRPDEDSLRDLYGSVLQASDLVLVCSLIDKATNIGGLARTSNIFGVGEFVVDNLRITDDNSFKQLAVTADKWIHMTEVAVKALARFIAVKRSEGYEIVGIEQTANSVSLQAMTFKAKTLLLLGNEKEGIPAELISHMDKCIQIPQLGQIRSLNVHVSGAIVLWEYMKQIKLSGA